MSDATTPRRLDAVNAALGKMELGDTLTACVGPEGGCGCTFGPDDEEERAAWMEACPLCERLTLGSSVGRA